MKRTQLLLLAFLAAALYVSEYAFARLYEARLMGVDREVVELGDFESGEMCLPVEAAGDEVEAGENVAENHSDSESESTRVPALNTPML